MNKHKELIKNMSFKQIKDTIYQLDMPDGMFNEYLGNLLKTFTVGDIDTFSPLMDVSLGEELIARIVADAFVHSYKETVVKATGGVIINCRINEINYKISIANNQEKLGGIVYGVVG